MNVEFSAVGDTHIVTRGATGVIVNDVTYIYLPSHTATTLYACDRAVSWVTSWDLELVDIRFFRSTSDVWDGVVFGCTQGYRKFLRARDLGKLMLDD